MIIAYTFIEGFPAGYSSSIMARVLSECEGYFLSFQKKRLGSIWNHKPGNSCSTNCTSSGQFTHLQVFFLDPRKTNTEIVY